MQVLPQAVLRSELDYSFYDGLKSAPGVLFLFLCQQQDPTGLLLPLVPLSNDAAKILKMCILEARGMKSNIADTEHVLLAILREKNNMAASVLESNNVNYVKVLELIAAKLVLSLDNISIAFPSPSRSIPRSRNEKNNKC